MENLLLFFLHCGRRERNRRQSQVTMKARMSQHPGQRSAILVLQPSHRLPNCTLRDKSTQEFSEYNKPANQKQEGWELPA
ncbi:hypothetical protein DNTS_028475 [Danionella cerebrum]|uniref:Uncharacterized protein n=1 Tax=Danionella cerebrum TaxID=2873325 RepID=A0A553R7H4_9TELE|nr:hypothetical protein DNTS_028475 [Danionella translucida]